VNDTASPSTTHGPACGNSLVEALEVVGLSHRVVSLRPIGNVKG
jgi:hypothetical protein